MSLRVQNFNFDFAVLTVYDSKGWKDRTVSLPESLVPGLKKQFETVVALHQSDLDAGYTGVFLYGLLEKKYKNAAKELVWQWFFPAKELTLVPGTKEHRRYHCTMPCAKGNNGGGETGKDSQASYCSHVSVQFRQPSAAGKLRYPHDSGAAGL